MDQQKEQLSFTTQDAVELLDTRLRHLPSGEYATFLYDLVEMLKENADLAADEDSGAEDPGDEDACDTEED